MKRNFMALAGLAVLLVAAGCKDEPMAGEYSVDLVTPNSDDGAIQFVASADVPEMITGITVACSPCKLFLVKVSDTEYKGVLTGQISAGTLFRVGVSDKSDKKGVKPYHVTISSVASRTYQPRLTSGYSVTLKP